MFLLKSLCITFLTCFTLMSCNGRENSESALNAKGFSIEGSFKNKKAGLKVSLDELLPTGLKAFDSATTDEQGTFLIKGNFSGKSFFLLRYQGGDIPLYLDSITKIKIDIDPDHKEVYTIKGSIENNKLKEIVDIGREHFKKLDALQLKYPSMPTEDSAKQIVMDEYMKIMDDRKARIIQSININPPSAAGVFGALFMLPSQDDLPAFIRSEINFYDSLDKRYQSKFTGMKHFDILHGIVNSVGATKVGKEMSEINLPDPKGNMIKLSSLRGQYVLVDFWASWCRPCRAENPNVVRAYKKYHSKGFEILGVSLDDNAKKWELAIAADNLDWKHVSELKGWQSEVCRKFNVNSIPFSILLDKEGKIIATNLRGEELDAKLHELLGE